MAQPRSFAANMAPLLASVTLVSATLAAGALPAPAAAAGPRAARAATTPTRGSAHVPLAQSPELWATINVCDTASHPDTIGIRGSMPTDGHPHDAMYMRFLVQSLDVTTHSWADVGTSADSGFVPIGSASMTRQAGRTFEFKPTTTTYTLRGLVEFQWRRDGRTVHAASRTTTAGHTSLAGAEPKGFSAATCALM